MNPKNTFKVTKTHSYHQMKLKYSTILCTMHISIATKYINDYPVFSSLLLINLILSAHFFIPCVFVSEVCAIWDCSATTSLHEIVEEIAFMDTLGDVASASNECEKVSSFRTTPFGAFCICSWPSWLSRSQS